MKSIVKSSQVKSSQVKSSPSLKWFKQLFCILLALSLLLTSNTVVYADEQTIGSINWYYELSDVDGDGQDEAINVRPLNFSGAALIVPEIINDGIFDHEVYSIGNGTDSITSAKLATVMLPKTLKKINANAFSGQSALKTIGITNSTPQAGSTIFADTVVEIGASAFQGCTLLNNISFPEHIQTIGSSAFENCNGLTKIYIPKSVTNLGSNAFKACSNLANIELDANVNYSKAFTNDPNLLNIVIGENVNTIAGDIFHITEGKYINTKDRNIYFLNPNTKIGIITQTVDAFSYSKTYDISPSVQKEGKYSISGTYDDSGKTISNYSDTTAETTSNLQISCSSSCLQSTYYQALGCYNGIKALTTTLSLSGKYTSSVPFRNSSGSGGPDGYSFDGCDINVVVASDSKKNFKNNFTYNELSALSKMTISDLYSIINYRSSVKCTAIKWSSSSSSGYSSSDWPATVNITEVTAPTITYPNVNFSTYVDNMLAEFHKNNIYFDKAGNLNIYTGLKDANTTLAHTRDTSSSYTYPDVIKDKQSDVVTNGGISTCNVKEIEGATIPYVVPKISYNICFDKNY